MILMEALLLSIVGALVGTRASMCLMEYWDARVPQVNGFIDGRLDPLLILEGFVDAGDRRWFCRWFASGAQSGAVAAGRGTAA